MKASLVMGLTLAGIISCFSAATAADKIVFASRDAVISRTLAPTLERFKAAHPEIEVEMLELTLPALYEKFLLNMREGTNAIDVVLLNDTWITEFAGNKWLADLGAMGPVDPDLVPNAVSVGKVDGTQVALPWMGNVQMFAYRKDLFDAAGLPAPTTFSGALDAASKLAKEGQTGLVFRGLKGNGIVTGFLPILRAFGGSILDDTGAVTLGAPATVEAIKFMLKMRALAPKDVAAYESGEVRDALQQSKTAMAFEVWPAWLPDLDNPEKSQVVGKVDLVPMPGETVAGQPTLGLWMLAIPTDSRNAAAAWTFIQFVLSEQNELAEVIQNAKPPVRYSSFKNPEAVAKYRWLPTQLASLEAGVPNTRLTNYNRVESIISDYLSLALIDQISPEDAATQMARAVERVLKSN